MHLGDVEKNLQPGFQPHKRFLTLLSKLILSIPGLPLCLPLLPCINMAQNTTSCLALKCTHFSSPFSAACDIFSSGASEGVTYSVHVQIITFFFSCNQSIPRWVLLLHSLSVLPALPVASGSPVASPSLHLMLAVSSSQARPSRRQTSDCSPGNFE